MYTYCTFFLVLSTLSIVFGCSSTPESMKSAEAYFTEGMEFVEAPDYVQAIDRFEQLNAIHPFSKYAEQSLLELAWVYFVSGDSNRCRITIARFLRQYADSSQVDYAYYLRGVSYYEDDRNFLHDNLGVDYARRSLQGAKLAIQDFSYLVNQFPHSRYAKDSRLYMLYIRDSLARKELLVGEFYMQRKAYVAALNRALQVLSTYAEASYTPHALALGARAYDGMGLTTEASEMREKLTNWYPDFTLQAQAN